MGSFSRASCWAWLTLSTIVMSAPAYGQGVVLRDGFELDSVGAAPTGWSAPRGGMRAFVAESNSAEGRRALVLELNDPAKPDAIGAISLRLGAQPYRGREVRFEAFVRSVLPNADSWSALWLRVDRLPNDVLYLDNMQDRPIRVKDWQRYRIIADVAQSADSLILGAMLVGPGLMVLDSVTLDVVDSAPIANRPPPTLAALAYVDSALALMQRWSLRRGDVDWPTLRARAELRVRGATTLEDTYRAIRAALAELGDHHSFFMLPGESSDWSSMGAEYADSSARLYDGRIGYLPIPAYGGSDSATSVAFARQMQRAIARVDAAEACGWVVDLRENTGGNMWPMLAGIGPVLGEGIAGYFVTPDSVRRPWAYRKGATYEDTVPQVTVGLPFYQLKGSALPPVAVLVSGETGSSGEAIMVSFLARPRTRTFGVSTAGLSTANEAYPLPDGAQIFLTVGVMADRSGRAYGDAIDPDVLLAPSDLISSDPTIDAALQWLRGQPECN